MRDPIKEDVALLHHGTLAEVVSALFSYCPAPAMGYAPPAAGTGLLTAALPSLTRPK